MCRVRIRSQMSHLPLREWYEFLPSSAFAKHGSNWNLSSFSHSRLPPEVRALLCQLGGLLSIHYLPVDVRITRPVIGYRVAMTAASYAAPSVRAAGPDDWYRPYINVSLLS